MFDLILGVAFVLLIALTVLAAVLYLLWLPLHCADSYRRNEKTLTKHLDQ